MALLLIDRDVVRLNNPPADRFPVQGIDVSHHQGVVDWERVASNRAIRFVYIKASEGGDFRDASVTENWDGARRAGLVEPTGVMSATGGRPAELFRFAGLDPQGAPLGGLSLPTQR